MDISCIIICAWHGSHKQPSCLCNNTKEHVDRFEFGWELMKALVKPNMQTRLAREGLSKHLQNWITHILGVKHNKNKNKKLYGPFFMDGVQLPQRYSHFEAVYFLPFSSQKLCSQWFWTWDPWIGNPVP